MKGLLNIFERVFAVAALFFLTEGLLTTLAPGSEFDDRYSSGSLAIRLVGIFVGLFAMGLFALLTNPLARLWRFWPILILPLLTFLSVLWAADPDISLRRSGALILTTVFGMWLAERFTPRALMNLMLVTLALLCVASYVAIFAVPSMGVHTDANTVNLAHLGSWRGMLAHKNDFGRIAALSADLFLIAALLREKRRTVYLGLMVAAWVLVVGSQSGQSVVLVALPSFVVLLLCWLRTMPSGRRGLVITMLIPLSVVVYLVSDLILSIALEMLGKEPTLTGRTEIWAGVLDSLQHNFIFGGGYGSGWRLVSYAVYLRTGTSVGHAHNGYLDLAVDIGVVGVALALVLYIAIAVRSVRMFLIDREPEFTALGATYLVFLFAGNWVASFLLNYNSIYWVLIVCLYGKLFAPQPRRSPAGSRVLSDHAVGAMRG